jgi:NAD(P)-dependent dehydrogenase (short-subunit alcohol dehydrogenase family)
MVTGANSGIGKEVSRGLASMGANVVLVCRSKEKGEDTIVEISKDTGNKSLELMIADFSSLSSVRKLASDYNSTHDKLHVLVNNAGLIIGKKIITEDGLEVTFQVNYLSHFLLTNLLLDTLKKSAPSRIVNVSSSAHYSGHVDFENLNAEKKFSTIKAYSDSKLEQVFFTYELARRLQGSGVTVNAVHPGAVRTHWGDEGGLWSIGIRIARPFLISPTKGAMTPLFVATSPKLEGVSGKYYSNMREEASSKESYDKAIGSKLWQESVRLSHLEP